MRNFILFYFIFRFLVGHINQKQQITTTTKTNYMDMLYGVFTLRSSWLAQTAHLLCCCLVAFMYSFMEYSYFVVFIKCCCRLERFHPAFEIGSALLLLPLIVCTHSWSYFYISLMGVCFWWSPLWKIDLQGTLLVVALVLFFLWLHFFDSFILGVELNWWTMMMRIL